MKIGGDAQGGAGGKKPPVGTLGLIPRDYTHPAALNAQKEYVVHYRLLQKPAGGSLSTKKVVVGECKSAPTAVSGDGTVAQWAQEITGISVYNTRDDCLLEITVMTVGVGRTPGTAIASGLVDLNAPDVALQQATKQ